MLELNAGSNAIFLYAPLPRFLRSVADKGLWGRRWARRLHALAARDTRLDFGLSVRRPVRAYRLAGRRAGLADAACAGRALIARFPGRVRTLDSEQFLTRRAGRSPQSPTISAFRSTNAGSREIAGGPAFATHSKEIGRAFDPESHFSPKAAIPVIDEEILMVAQWTRSVADHAGIPLEFLPDSALTSRG